MRVCSLWQPLQKGAAKVNFLVFCFETSIYITADQQLMVQWLAQFSVATWTFFVWRKVTNYFPKVTIFNYSTGLNLIVTSIPIRFWTFNYASFIYFSGCSSMDVLVPSYINALNGTTATIPCTFTSCYKIDLTKFGMNWTYQETHNDTEEKVTELFSHTSVHHLLYL